MIPGPWKAGGIFITSKGGTCIGTVDSVETAPRARRKRAPTLAQAYEHAELMAAAPDMLAELRGIAAGDQTRESMIANAARIVSRFDR